MTYSPFGFSREWRKVSVVVDFASISEGNKNTDKTIANNENSPLENVFMFSLPPVVYKNTLSRK
jgi:hypothetical protein